MKFIKLKKRERNIAYIVAAILAIFLIEKFFFSGLRSKTRSLKQQIRLQESNLKTAISVSQEKEKIIQEKTRYQPYLEIGASSSDREIITKFLKEVEKIAGNSGISIINLDPENEPEVLNKIKRYNADLRAEGPPKKIFSFLHKIQSSNLLIELDKLSLSAKGENADTIKFETTISIFIPE